MKTDVNLSERKHEAELQFLSIKEICERLRINAPTLWRLRRNRKRKFPRPIAISPGRVVFDAAEIRDYVKNLPRAESTAETPLSSTRTCNAACAECAECAAKSERGR